MSSGEDRDYESTPAIADSSEHSGIAFQEEQTPAPQDPIAYLAEPAHIVVKVKDFCTARINPASEDAFNLYCGSPSQNGETLVPF